MLARWLGSSHSPGSSPGMGRRNASADDSYHRYSGSWVVFRLASFTNHANGKRNMWKLKSVFPLPTRHLIVVKHNRCIRLDDS